MRSRWKAGLAAIALLGSVVFAALVPATAPATGASSERPADTTATCTGVLVARLDGSIAVLADKNDSTCARSIAQGSLAGIKLNKPIIGSAALPGGNGYWLLGSDGGVFSFGAAQFYGSTGGLHLNAPVVGMASTPDGGGYWLVASDGGIFSFGDAQFYGSTGGLHLNKPVVGMASDGATGGYWLVASDGGVFAFHAPFFGSMGGQPLNAPVRFMTGTPAFGGYRLVAIDGGVFDFGDAQFYGSAAGPGTTGWSALATSPSNNGYWLFAATGLSGLPNYQAFGDASPSITFDGGDALSTALVVGASTVSFSINVPSPPPEPAVGGIFNDVSCATASTCVAVGGTSSGGALIERSTDTGANFTADTVPTGASVMNGVDCNSALHCVAVGTTSAGTEALVSDDGGVTWTLHTTPATILDSVACENDADCAAVGGNNPQMGSVYSVNGGSSWQNSTTAPPLSVDVSCDSTTCVAAGGTVAVSTDAGAHWTQKTVSGGGGPLLTASCTTDGATCLAVGPNAGGLGNPSLPGELGRSIDGGSTWTNASANLPASSATLQNVFCWSTTDCMAIGPDPSTTNPASIIGTVTTNAGAAWGALFQPGTGSLALKEHANAPVFGFTCSTSGTCIVVSDNSTGAAAYTSGNGGASWTASNVN